MDKLKKNNKNYGTAFFATAFLAAFFFEFYWIINEPFNYFMMLGTGFIMLVMGYLTFDSLLKEKADNDAIRNEQNEMILKAQKAIYIATKKSSKDAAKVQAQSIKAMEILINRMILSQQELLKKNNANKADSISDEPAIFESDSVFDEPAVFETDNSSDELTLPNEANESDEKHPEPSASTAEENPNKQLSDEEIAALFASL